MPFKPNYNHQRAERNRLKQAKKDAKLREREEAAARRKAGLDDPSAEAAPGDETAGDETGGDETGGEPATDAPPVGGE
jgi:hypothetical protein